jgi:hypothetical protein
MSNHTDHDAGPPDRTTQGDVSQPGHAGGHAGSEEVAPLAVHQAGDTGDTAAGHGDAHSPDPHGGHGDTHGGHGGEEPEEEATPPPLAALLWPLAILLIVTLAVLPAVASGFARYSPGGDTGHAETTTETGQDHGPAEGEVTTPVVTPAGTPPSTGADVPTVIPQPANPRTAEPTEVRGPATVVPTPADAAPTATTPATPTTVAVAPPMGDTAQGALRTVELAGQTFQVEATEIVPDWQFSDQPGVASWISGTVINYIVGLPYSAANAALFDRVQPDDLIRLTVATDDVLTFRVSDRRRVAKDDTAVLAQDHPGVTLLLVGEPNTADRALVAAQYVPRALAP